MKKNSFNNPLVQSNEEAFSKGKGRFWKRVARGAGGVFLLVLTTLAVSCSVGGAVIQAVGAAFVERAAERSGMSRDDAVAGTRALAEGLFGNSSNADKGIAYVTANDKYLKQEIVANEVFDAAGKLTGEEQLMNTLKGMTSAQLTYKSENLHATTDEERKAAFDKRSQNWADVTYDAYEAKTERKAKFLAEKSGLAKSLKQQGYSSTQALEIAGSMLAVQRSNMPQEEKERYYRAFLPKEPVENIVTTVENVNSDNYTEKPVVIHPTPEEIAAREEAERLERERIEKENAVNSVNETVVDLYKFDITDLTGEQIVELDKIADVLNKYQDLSLEIKGHTCSIGYKSVNERVGLRRAETAKSYLVEKGISADRISTATAGENEPIVENTSSENRKQNRRLTFTIK